MCHTPGSLRNWSESPVRPEPAQRVLLLGDPVAESLSPVFQNAAFAAANIACHYDVRSVDVRALHEVLEEIRTDGDILGANVTIPHKEAVLRSLDALDPLAEHVGAVNTISRDGRLLKGWNTDVEGFSRALGELGFDPRGRSAVIAGAGGAARAVVAALQPEASALWVVSRNLDRARRLCHDLGVKSGGPRPLDELRSLAARADLLVNATPVDAFPPDWVTGRQMLFDLRTRQSPAGRLMLLHQGAAAFQIWTGRPAPMEAMRAALDQAFPVVARG
jgi:shikimate dehydrogenase